MIKPPNLRVLIDFVTDLNPTTSNAIVPEPIWVDVTSKVREGGFSIKRGRERPLDRNEAGTATIVFDNFDREFDPESAASFGLVTTMRHIRIEARHDRTTSAFKVGASTVGSSDTVGGGDSFNYDAIFDGYIESWEFDYPALGNDAIATAKCMDLLGVMAKDNFSTPFAIDSFYWDAALDYVFNLVPYAGRLPVTYNTTTPSPDKRDWISAGVTSAGNSKYIVYVGIFTNTPVRSPVDAIAEADGGNFFINRSGLVAYRDHDWPLQPAGKIHIAVDAEKFHDISRNMDETLIYNYVYLVSPDNSVYGLAEDKPSQARYLKRPYPREVGLGVEAQLQERAESELFRHREPQVFLSRLDLSNLVTDWRRILRADLWDIITVHVPLPNGDIIEQRSMIEGIEISSPSHNIWNIIWQLSLPFFPNILPADDSGFEGADGLGTIGGWEAEANCTLLPQDTQVEAVRHRTGHFDPTPFYTYEYRGIYAAEGAWVLQAEASGSGDLSCISPTVPVEPRRAYVVKAFLRLVHFGQAGGVPSETNPATDATRMVHIELAWYDASHVLISTVVGTARLLYTTSNQQPITTWNAFNVDGTAPDDAAEARIRVKTVGTGKAGVYVDDVSFKRGG
jgi:hypothetical protein